jgi:hypothetical protein
MSPADHTRELRTLRDEEQRILDRQQLDITTPADRERLARELRKVRQRIEEIEHGTAH